jgi:hypothetical protein
MPISHPVTERRHYLPLVALPGGVWLGWISWGLAWPRWVVMWLMAMAFFAGCKWLTWRAARPDGTPWWRQAAYLFLWPGLDAEAFLFHRSTPRRQLPTRTAWWMAAFNLILGAVFFWVGARQWPEAWWWARGWTGMTGFILAAHCGLFQILSYTWQNLGLDARPLMNWPVCSRNVSEFWGRRWNTAFRDLAHRFLFQPLAQRWGPRRALLAGFFFSGVVHELVVTVPAGGGYGGPTLFFSCQGAAILWERSRVGRSLGLGRGFRGWAFTLLELTAIASLAFPATFVQNVVLPFMRAAGAL